MKILFLHSAGVNYKKSSWLTTNRYFIKYLEQNGNQVIHYNSEKTILLYALKALNLLMKIFTKKSFSPMHTRIISRHYGRICSRVLSTIEHDVVFAPSASTELSFLKSSKPVVYLTDCTFKLMDNFYDSFSHLTKSAVMNGNNIEHRALHNSDFIIFPSEWARMSAVNDYEIDINKTRVVSYGCNLERVPSEEIIYKKIDKKHVCYLLFLGVEWDRKGGDKAFETLKYLKSKNFKAKLIVCGCTPPADKYDDDMVVYPYLNKNIESEKLILNDILYNSHFLFVPTKADCSPVIFAEAAAYGMPVVSNDVGGVSGMVKNGYNGILLDVNSSPEDYGNEIMRIFEDYYTYRSFVMNSHYLYEDELNWEVWGMKANECLMSALKKPTYSKVG